MHVPTLVLMLNVLQLLVRLMRTFANSFFVLFILHSFGADVVVKGTWHSMPTRQSP